MVDIEQVFKQDISKKEKIQTQHLRELRTTVLETEQDI